jgi:hypothetical protein
MKVTIPATAEHQGFYSITVEISDFCPVCGGKRGKVFDGISYDGSRRLHVDCWNNPCGHIDKYCDVRKEAKKSKQGE